ncbi:MAG: hypothetical protein RQ745_10815 [Longimicrobiales bacterium]|nr:hypothetical protein [Longimicrobiales bacterium]
MTHPHRGSWGRGRRHLVAAALLLLAPSAARAQPLDLDAVFPTVATEIIAWRAGHFATAYCVGVAEGDEAFRAPNREQLLAIERVVSRRGHLAPEVRPRGECGERTSEGVPREEGVFDLLVSWVSDSEAGGTVTIRLGPAIGLVCPVRRVDDEVVIDPCRELPRPGGRPGLP